MLASPETLYVSIFPLSMLAILLLLGIAFSVTRVDSTQTLRRHSGRDTYWRTTAAVNEPSTGVLAAAYEHPRHGIPEPIDEHTGELEIMVDGIVVESWPSVGRHARDSIVQQQRVPSHWVPTIGNLRIALIETPTAEYFFARKPKEA